MKRICILVEGQTEEQFINELLVPYFRNKGVYDVRPIKLTGKKNEGGMKSYGKLRKDAHRLTHEPDTVVSSMFDLFRIPKDMPSYSTVELITDPVTRVTEYEKAMFNNIGMINFVPYIQLHEMEGLLFTKVNGFVDVASLTPDSKEERLGMIQEIIEQYPNPELINSGAATAPGKRLKKIFPNYEKPLHGNYIALDNGLNAILEKCPRFAAWLSKLTKMATT